MRKDYDNMGTSNKNNNWTPNKQKLTPCICPRCKAKHAKLLFWTGKIPALKFCQSCEQIAERDYAPDTYTLGYRDIDELISY